MTNEEKERRIASVSFSKRKPAEREAFKVLQEYLQKPNPDDPERQMTQQQILIAALLALGELGSKQSEQKAVVVPGEKVSAEIAQFKEQVAVGLLHINRTLVDIQKQVNLMAEDGRLTPAQAREVTRVFDAQAITQEFEKNIGTTFKPGRKKRNG